MPEPRINDHGQPIGEPVPGWSPRARPESGPFKGRFCTLVPLSADHAVDLYATCAGPGREPLWTYLAGAEGAFATVDDLAAYLDKTVHDPASISLAITGPDGRALGFANYMRIDPTHGSVEVGGILFGTELQRTTAATEAMYLMACHVFEGLGYRRYEWKCDALNAPSRAAALRLGFTYEGTFRNAVVYKGRSRDTAWFSITDSEWPALAAAYERWLGPANFAADGSQRTTLAAQVAEVRSSAPGAPNAGTGVPHLGTRGTLA